jgi:hypothetical protein
MIRSSENDDRLDSLRKDCLQHTQILRERSDIRRIAYLFYGATDHCKQVTEDNISQITKTMNILLKLHSWNRSHSGTVNLASLLLISDLCAFLKPFFLYGPRSINSMLNRDDSLLRLIPLVITCLLTRSTIKYESVEVCMNFYSCIIRSRCNMTSVDDETICRSETTEMNISESDDDAPKPLLLSKDLIASYYTLYRQCQATVIANKQWTQEKQRQKLLDTEWKHLDMAQLKCDYEQLKETHRTMNDELTQMRNELQRAQFERDQFRQENIHLSNRIDRLERVPSSVMTIESNHPLISSSSHSIDNTTNDIIEQLKDRLPHQITAEQAEQYIREIYKRRTTFADHDMRKSICGSLKHLGSDLYSSSVHFLQELIQVSNYS